MIFESTWHTSNFFLIKRTWIHNWYDYVWLSMNWQGVSIWNSAAGNKNILGTLKDIFFLFWWKMHYYAWNYLTCKIKKCVKVKHYSIFLPISILLNINDIWILYHFSTLRWHKHLKLFPIEDSNTFIVAFDLATQGIIASVTMVRP